jgi:hypothetical protein
MRFWIGWLMLAACSEGGDVDDKGADPTDDTDPGFDTDVPGDPEIIYEAVEPVARWVREEFNGVKFVSFIPEDPVALLFVFHGTGGGGGGVVDTAEMTWLLNHMVEANVGFFAPDSINRADGLFDTGSNTSSNPDWQFLTAARDNLVTTGLITADLPLFTLGFSAGGGFANYVGHAGLRAGWPVRGALFHNTLGRSNEFGDPPDVPCMWMAAEFDERVSYDGMESNYQEHLADGFADIWAPHFESRLYPTRFVRSGSLTENQSRDVWQLAVDNGYFDDRGHRLFGDDEIEAKVEEFTSSYDVYYPKPVTAQLNVVLATHAVNGEHAPEETAFVVGEAAR